MGAIKKQLCYRRSQAMEEAAVKGIIDLFTKQRFSTSQKNTNEIMSLVLMQIIGSCITKPGESNTKESLSLQHANEYLESLRKKLISGRNINMPLTGNTLEDIINNLSIISNTAKQEENARDIQNRLHLFINKLSDLQQASVDASKKVLLLSIVVGAITSYIFLKDLDYSNAANFILAFLFFIMMSVATYRLVSYFL